MGKRREKLQDSSHCLEIFILQMYIVHIIDNLTLSYGYNYFKNMLFNKYTKDNSDYLPVEGCFSFFSVFSRLTTMSMYHFDN